MDAGAVLGGVVLLALLIQTLWLRRQLARLAPPPPPEAALAALAAELEPRLQAGFRQLEERHREAAELVARAEHLVAQLAEAATTPTAADAPAADGLTARTEARRLLAEGTDLTEVAAQTGLPEGELRVLANLVAARRAGG